MNLTVKHFHTIAYRVLILTFILFTIISCNKNISINDPLSLHGTVFHLSNANSGQTVSVSLKDTVDIRLQTIGPGEYGSPEISSSSIYFEKILRTPRNEINPGGPVQYYQFVADLKGQAKISILHTYNSVVFEITIEVK
jgi:hypothetical protein